MDPGHTGIECFVLQTDNAEGDTTKFDPRWVRTRRYLCRKKAFKAAPGAETVQITRVECWLPQLRPLLVIHPSQAPNDFLPSRKSHNHPELGHGDHCCRPKTPA